MRFLMIVSGYPPAKKAGMEQSCQRMATALVRRGHSVTVLTQGSTDLPEHGVEDGVVVRRVVRPTALGPLWGATYMHQVGKWVRRLAAEWDFCLCHKLDLHSPVAAREAARLGRHSASLIHNTGPRSDIATLGRHKGGGLLVAAAKRSSGFFVLSGVSHREMLAAGIPERKLYPYRHFVDVEKFSPGGEPPAKPEFLFVGRLHAQKNLLLLIDAFERVAKGNPDVSLRIVGTGPEEEKVGARIACSRAGNRIVREGWTDDPVSAFRRALAVVLSSDHEGLSYTQLEAMSCGKPIITTEVSGARESLDPKGELAVDIRSGTFLRAEAGFITRTGDAEGLAAAMAYIATNEPIAAGMGKRAREVVLEHFAEDVCIERFLDGVERITAGGES